MKYLIKSFRVTLSKRIFNILLLVILIFPIIVEGQVFLENFGPPVTGSHTATTYTNYSSPQTKSGNGIIASTNTPASSGYTGFSGDGNVRLDNKATAGSTPYEIIIENINTINTNGSLSLGIYKMRSNSRGNELKFYQSTDGTIYTEITKANNFLGNGTAWFYSTITGVSAASNLWIKIVNESTTAGDTYYLDDIMLGGTLPCPSTVPTITNGSRCGTGTVNLFASGGVTYKWYDAPTGGTLLSSHSYYITPSISTTTTYYVAATSGACEGPRAAVTATVNTRPATPTTTGATVCGSGSATLTASGGTNYNWYAASSGGAVLGTGSTFITPVVNASRNYYVATVNADGCESATRTAALVTVQQISPFLTETCGNGTSGAINTYTSWTSGFTMTGTGTIWVPTTTTWELIDGTTSATPADPNHTINQKVVEITGGSPGKYWEISNINTTGLNNIQLYFNGRRNNTGVPLSELKIEVFNNATLAATLSAIPMDLLSYTTNSWARFYTDAGSTTIPATSNLSIRFTCLNTNTSRLFQVDDIRITADNLPTPTATGVTRCSAGTATLTASGAGSYKWYDASTGGTLLASTASYTTPSISTTTTYYVAASSGSCEGSRIPVTVTISSTPSVSATGVTICGPATATLTASGGETYNWYNVSSGGTSLGTASTFTTSVLSSNTTYYVEAVNSGVCASSRLPVAVTVNLKPALSQIPTTNLLSYFKMSGNANDERNNNQGILVNSPALTTDRYDNANSAYLLNGSNQYITTTQSYTNPSNFTISIWIKTSSTSGGKIMGFGNIQTGQSTAWDRHIWMGNEGKVYFGVKNAGVEKYITSPGFYNDNEWHLLTASLSPTNGIKLYIDGAMVASDATVTGAENFTGYWKMGYDKQTWVPAPSSWYFNGSIDDALIYERELTATEINTLYNSPDGVSSNSPVCIGGTLNLSVVATGGATYAWTGPDGFTSNLQNPSISGMNSTKSGGYGLTVTGSNGCTATGYASGKVSALLGPNLSQPTTGLQSRYFLDGNSKDIMGANDGYFINNPTLTTDRFGNANSAYSFNGSNQYFTTKTSYTNPNNFTISLWFKTSVDGGKLAGFGNYQFGGSTSFDRHIYMNSGRLYFGVYTGSHVVINSTSAYNDNQWHMMTASLSAGGIKLYVDGRLVASDAATTAGQNFTGYWRFAYDDMTTWPNIPANWHYTGSMDDIYIYNQALSDAEVWTLYTSGTGAGSNSPVCPGSSINLTAPTFAGASYSWTGPNGFSSTSQNPTIPTISASTAGVYSLQVTSSTGCISTTNNRVIEATIPAAPTVTGAARCGTGTVTLTASGSVDTYNWYNVSSGGSSLATTASYTTPSISSTTTYYVSSVVNGCEGPRASVTASIDVAPTVTASGITICGPTSATLTASGGSTYNWYTVSSGGTPIGTGSPFTTPTLSATTTYYVEAVSTNGGCTGSRIAVPITVNLKPDLSQIPATNLLSYYKFNGNANDFQNTNNGILINNPTLTTDRFNNANSAYQLNGTSQYITTTQSYVNPTDFTISVWFKTTTTSGGKIIGFGDAQTGGSGNYDRMVWMANDGRITYAANPGMVGKTLYSNSTYNDGNWHLVTVTSSSVTGSKLYIDGTLIVFDATAFGGQNITGYWRIGYDAHGWGPVPTSPYFAGALDDVLIYDRELTFAEVSTIYTAPDGASSNSPVCIGGTLNLSAKTLGSVSYAWTGPNGFTSSTQNPSVPSMDNSKSGVYTLTVTGANGCTATGQTIGSTSSLLGTNLSQPSTGLQSRYLLDGNGKDIMGINHGQLAFAPTTTTDRFGNANAAYSFNGTNQFMTTSVSYTNPINFTISIWFKTSAAGGKLIAFGANQFAASNNYDRHIYMTSGRIYFGANPGTPTLISTTNTYNDGNWHMATATLSNTAGIKLYIDGVLQASNATILGGENFTGYWKIGYERTSGWGSAPANDYFNGALDDFYIYNTVLSDAEVSSLYTSGTGAGNNSPVCTGSPINLTAPTFAGATYSWTGPNGFSSSAQNPIIPSISSSTAGIYTLQVTASTGCINTVNTRVYEITLPSAPAVTGGSRCGTGTVTLSASGSSGTYNWYNASSGGTSLATTATYTTPSISASTTYYVASVVNGCEGPRTSVTASVYTSAPGDPNVFGNNEWIAYCYSGYSFETYQGYYTESSLSFDTRTRWNSANNPSLASGYQGCTVTDDNHSISFKRTNFPAGYYKLDIPEHDRKCSLIVNGVIVFVHDWYGEDNHVNVWTGYLDNSSTVEFRYSEASGISVGRITMTDLGSNPSDIIGATIYKDTTICYSGNPNPFTEGITVKSIQDAYVRSGIYSGTANGSTDPTIIPVKSNGDADLARYAYITFDIATLPATINSAILNLYGYISGGNNDINIPVEVYSISDVNWDENSITFTTRPATGALLNSTVIYNTTGQNYYWDITSYVASEKSGGKTRISLLLKASINTNDLCVFTSKEAAGTNYPKLIVNQSKSNCTLSYQWESSAGCTSTWSSIPGATSSTYDIPSGLTQTTCYRRKDSDACGNTAYSNTITVTINNPSAPIGTGSSVCGSGTVNLSASGSSAGYKWYDASTGGTLLSSSNSYTTPALSTTTNYYVAATSAQGCEGTTRTAVTATVNTIPSAPSVTDGSRCGTGTVTLSASGSAGTYNWYNVASGGSSLETAASFTTPSISATTTYYVSAVENGCEGPRAAVTATINTIPDLSQVSESGLLSYYRFNGNADDEQNANQGLLQNNPALTSDRFGNSNSAYSFNGTSQFMSTTVTYSNPNNFTISLWFKTTTSTGGRLAGFSGDQFISSSRVDRHIYMNAGRIYFGVYSGGTYVVNSTATYNDNNWHMATASLSSTEGMKLYIDGSFIAGNASVLSGEDFIGYWRIAFDRLGGWPNMPTSEYFNGSLDDFFIYNRVLTDTEINSLYTMGVPPGSNSPVCSGSTLNLTAPTFAGASYLWTGPNSFSSSSQNPTLTMSSSAAGEYTIQVTDSNGCVNSAEVTVMETPIPAAPSVTDASRCGTGTVTLSASGSSGTYNWYNVASGGSSLETAASFTTPSISSTTTYYVSAVENGCEGARSAVIATVNAIPAAPSVTDGSRCGTGTVTLSASGSAGTYNWYNVASGGSSLETAASFTTPSIATTTTYYVAFVENGCEGPRTAVTATINTIPAAPSVTDGSRCGTGTVTLSASGSAGTYNWYNVASGGSSLETAASFTTPSISATTTYYVSAVENGCEGPRATVTATINTIPAAPTVTDGSRCGSGTVALSASGSSGTYNWYNVASGGSSLETAASFTTPSISATTTYYVASVENGCEGQRAAVTATVNTTPSAPSVTDASRCGTGTVTLSASGSAGTYNWYNVASGGSSLETAASFTTPSISATTTYYVSAVENGCEGPRTAVTATINTIPAAPSVTDGSRCGTGTVSLSASGSSGTYNWYNVASGGSSLETAASFTTPSIATTTTYYVASVENGCEGPRTAVIASVNAIPAAPSVTDGSRCGTGTVALSASGSAGTYNWYNVSSGGSSLETSASFTSPSISATTTYFVSAVENGCEGARSAVIATVNAIPAAPSVTDGSRCGTGTVTLSASGSAETYNWYNVSSGGSSLETAASFTTPSISATTTYYVSAVENGCEGPRAAAIATVNAIPAAPSVTDASRCGTGTVILSASGSSGTYNWYNVASGGSSLETAASFTTPSISATTTYYVSAVENGCEGPRAAANATINTIPAAPSVTDGSRCGTGTVTLSASGSAGTYNWYNVASGGSSLETAASFTTPSISATTTYYVSAVENGCEGPRAAVTATITTATVGGTLSSSATVCSGDNSGTITLSGQTGNVTGWESSLDNFATAGTAITNTTTSQNYTNLIQTTSYRAIVEATGCSQEYSSVVTITVNPTPAALSVTDGSRCGTGTVTLSASGSAGTYNWYNVASGGSSLETAASFTTPSISATTTYYVSAVENGCEGPRAAVTATINAIPAAPSVTDGSRCGTGTVTLSASGSAETYNWYNVSSGGSSLETAAAFTTPSISATTTYYVSAVENGCEGPRAAVTSTINAIPAAPSVTDGSRCGTGTVTLSASGSAETYNWYNVSSGGSSLETAASFTTPSISATTTYYVSAVENGCEGPRATVTATIATATVGGTLNSSATVCSGDNSGTITLSGQTGNVTGWESSLDNFATAGTAITNTTTSQNYTNLTQTTSYRAIVEATGCSQEYSSVVTITVNSTPAAPSVTDGSRCGTGTVTLSASGSSGTYNWYNVASGGSSLETAASFNTPSISATTTYYVGAVENGCEGARSAVIATVNAIPAAPSVTDGSRCGTGTVTLSASGSAGTYNWYNVASGGSSLETSASFTTPSISATTTYYVSAVENGCEGPRAAVTATINTIPSAPSVTDASRCGTGTVTLSASGSAGTYNWYNVASGGSSLETAASFTTPSISTTTTYYVSAVENGCEGPRVAVTATVNTIPSAPSVTDASRCGTGTVTLSASGSAGTYNWYNVASGGTSLETAASFTTPSIATTTTYYVASVENGCEGPRAAVTATINAIPAAPSVTDGSRCGTGTVTLSASGSAGTYNWYNVVSGGSSLETAASFTTPSIATTTTYYVASVENGCEGPRAAATATINTIPAAPSVTDGSRCGTGTVTLSASGSAGTYNWYNVASGGSSLETAASFTTPSISTTTTYYVSAVENGCEGPRTSVTATINTIPSAPSVTDGSRCGTGTVTLSASGSAGTYNWYNVASGGSSLETAASFTTPSIATATTYYVASVENGCEGQRAAVTATINTIPSAPSVTDGSRCGTGTVTLSASGSAGTYNWYNVASGGSSLETAASFTTPSISATTTYYVSAVENGCEGPRATVTATITTATVGGTLSSSATVCSGDNSGTITLSGQTGNVTGWESSLDNFATAGTAITNTTTSQNYTNLIQTTSYRAIVEATGCSQEYSSAVTITVNPTPAAPSVTDGSRCGTGTVTLSASGSAGTYNWYNVDSGGSSLETAASFTTPSISATTTYYVASVENSCEGPRATVTATITTATVGGTLSSSATVCSGDNSGTITLSGQTGNVTGWESSLDNFATAGTAITNTTTSQNYTNLIQTTSYRAIVEATGCSQEYSSAVTITVNPTPAAPSVTDGSRCGTGTVSLSASGSAGTYNWYNVSSGGSSLETAASFTTPSISATTTYYVSAVENGCESTGRTEVQAIITNSSVGGSINASQTVCMGTSGNLTLSGNIGSIQNWEYSYDNFTTAGITIANTSASINYSNIAQTTYYRAVVQAPGCAIAYSDTATLIVSPLPNNPISGNDSICASGTVTLTASGATNYKWYDSPSDGNLLHTGTSFTTPNITTTTSYFVSALNGDNCESTSRTEVKAQVFTQPDAGSITGNQIVCNGQNSGVIEITNYSGSISHWETSSDSFSSLIKYNSQNPQYSFQDLTNTTYYRAILISGNCPADTTSVITISVDTSPASNSGILKGDTSVVGLENSGTLVLSNHTGIIVRWEYSIDSFATFTPINASSATYSYSNLDMTTYYRAVVQSGVCQEVTSNIIRVEVLNIDNFEIYNSFTRNNDGINDEWKIKGIEKYPGNHITIINRWGEIVYEVSGYDNENKVWRGEGNTGASVNYNKLPEGTYFYEVDLGDGRKPFTGYVVIKE